MVPGQYTTPSITSGKPGISSKSLEKSSAMVPSPLFEYIKSVAPCAANCSATALPMPEFPPTKIIFFPFMVVVFVVESKRP